MRRRILVLGLAGLMVTSAAALAQNQTSRTAESAEESRGDELSTRRAPENLRLGTRDASVVSATPAAVSPLAAAASRRGPAVKPGIVITNETLSRSGPGLAGVTETTASVPLPPAPDTRKIIEQHDRERARWSRDIQQTRQSAAELQQQVRQLEAEAGTFEERIDNADDPARWEALRSSRTEVLERLDSARAALEQERRRAQELEAAPPRID